MSSPAARGYGGLSAGERMSERRGRLLQAGLNVIGTAGVAGLSVRRVIDHSGLAPRYFYEAFEDLDALLVSLFTGVVAELELTAQDAVREAPRNARARIHAALSATVQLLLTQPDKGRLVLVESLGSACLAPLRSAAAHRFAGLLAAQTRSVWRDREATSHAVLVTSQFAIGGLAETMSAALQGHLVVDPELLVDDLTELFLGTGTAFQRMPPG